MVDGAEAPEAGIGGLETEGFPHGAAQGPYLKGGTLTD